LWLNTSVFAQEVRRQDLDRGRRSLLADRADRAGEMLGAAVGKIVAIDRGDDHVRQPELCDRVGHPLRLGGFKRLRNAGLHVAERAGARAGVPHDHEGRVLLVPALADVRAAGFLADCHKAIVADDLAGVGIAARIRRAHADPVRL
jgi:hypothetical protein